MLKEIETYHLYVRYHDKQWNMWREWEEVSSYRLLNKYGETKEDWIESCKSWIKIGGRYEYKIVRRIEMVEYRMIFDEAFLEKDEA